MKVPTDDLTQIKLATAYVAASIVQTLNDAQPDFQQRFQTTLGEAYKTLRDEGGTEAGLELLLWTMETVKRKIV